MRTFIHPMSAKASNSGLEVFFVPATQCAIISTTKTEFVPKTSLQNSNQFQFDFPPTDDCRNLKSYRLSMKVVLDKTTEGAWTNDMKIIPSEYFPNTFLSNVDVRIGDQLVTPQTGNYHHRAFIDSKLMFSKEARASHENWAMLGTAEEREALVHHGKEFQLYAKLHVDIFNQPRYLIPNTPMKITLTLNKPEVFCKLEGLSGVNLIINDMRIYTESVTLDHNMRLAIEEGLSKSTAKYFYSQNIVTTHNIPVGVTTHSISDILFNYLPRWFMVLFMDNKEYSGQFTQSTANANENAFSYPHHNIKMIRGFKGGVLLNGGAYKPDFTNNMFAHEYNSFLKGIGQLSNYPMTTITPSDFKNKFCGHVFNLTPDQSNNDANCGTVAPAQQDTINIEMEFTTATTKALTMLVYAVYDKYTEIDQQRELKKINFP